MTDYFIIKYTIIGIISLIILFWIFRTISKRKNKSASIANTILINGFDKEGEPEIRIMNDGSLYIVFSFMPPLNENEDEGGALGEFEDFDKYLSNKLGENVYWVDREVFYIKTPKPETSDNVKELLENYWDKYRK